LKTKEHIAAQVARELDIQKSCACHMQQSHHHNVCTPY